LARIADPQTGAGVPLVDNFVFLGSGLAMLMLLRLSVRPATLLGLSVLLTLILGLSMP
jgi:hypothetical protein